MIIIGRAALSENGLTNAGGVSLYDQKKDSGSAANMNVLAAAW